MRKFVSLNGPYFHAGKLVAQQEVGLRVINQSSVIVKLKNKVYGSVATFEEIEECNVLYFLFASLASCRRFSSGLKLQHFKKSSGPASFTGRIEEKHPSISNLFLSVPLALFLFTNAYKRSILAFECGVTNTRRLTLNKSQNCQLLATVLFIDVSNTILYLFGTHPNFIF